MTSKFKQGRLTSEPVKEVLLDYLKEGKTTLVLNSNVPFTLLPAQLLKKDFVRIDLSLKFVNPTYIYEDCVVTTLSFNKTPYEVSIPYDAIYIIFHPNDDEHPLVFEDNIPASQRDQFIFDDND